MNKVAELVNNFKNFIEGVKSELKKCAWPTRPELLNSTVVVVVSVIFFGVFVGFSDWFIMRLLAIIIR